MLTRGASGFQLRPGTAGRVKSSQVATIDLKIAPLDLGPAIVHGAAGQQHSPCQTEDASLCALARGFCAMLPLACAQIEAQVSVSWLGTLTYEPE